MIMNQDSELALHPSKVSFTGRLLYDAATALNLPFAGYRLPATEKPISHVSFSEPTALENIPLPATGFVFAPFKASAKSPSLFISPDLVFEGDDLKSGHLTNELLQAARSTRKPTWHLNKFPQQHIATKEEFYSQVELARQAMDENAFQKVVLSRCDSSSLPSDFHPHRFFLSLCSAYPTAFVSLVSIPSVGTWIGATPELLLSLKENFVETMSLAGTRAVGDAAWSEKEIKEQQIVTDDISEKFTSLGLQHISIGTPETSGAGNMVHIKTTLRAEVPRGLSWRDLSQTLHPTPAIGGFPRDAAVKFIEATEQHERRYYTGYLGVVSEENASLFVNLRCIELLENAAVFYAGGGITPLSNAEAEWTEASLKMNTLRSVLEKS
jgi:isochorismate synthase